MQWLRANSSEQAIVISNADRTTANLIPAFVVRKTYFGHEIETINSREKEKEVLKFFQTNDDDQKNYFFLKNKKIDYVFVDKTNKNIYQAQEKKYLKIIFENNIVSIYQVL